MDNLDNMEIIAVSNLDNLDPCVDKEAAVVCGRPLVQVVQVPPVGRRNLDTWTREATNGGYTP